MVLLDGVSCRFTFTDHDRAPAPAKVLAVSFKTALHFVPEDTRAAGVQPPPIPAPGADGNKKPGQPGEWAYV